MLVRHDSREMMAFQLQMDVIISVAGYDSARKDAIFKKGDWLIHDGTVTYSVSEDTFREEYIPAQSQLSLDI